MIKNINILFLLLIFQLNFAQEDCNSKLYTLKFNVVEKTTRHNIGGPFIEIISGNESIGFASGDFDGYAKTIICSEKIKNDSITLKVFGMKSVPKTITYKMTSNISILVEVDYGESPFNNVNERQRFISKEYKIPFCGLTSE